MVSMMYLLAYVFQEIQVIKPGRNRYVHAQLIGEIY